MTEILLLVIKLSVVALIFAIGLSSTLADLTYLWHRPVQLLRSLLAMYVVIPLFGLLILKALTLPEGVEVALLVLAVSAGAPLLPRKLMKIGHESYMLSLVVTSSAVAVLMVPLWLEALRPLYGLTTELRSIDIALLIAKSFLGPIAIGMLVRTWSPETSEVIADRLLSVFGIVLIACIVSLLLLHGKLLLDVGLASLLALVGMTFAALTIGHVLGGPTEADRTGLAIACATRHVGIAMIVATSVPGARTAVIVVAYLIAAALVSIPYLRWRQKKQPTPT